MLNFLLSTAYAQDVVLPPVPTTISPVLQWVMGVAGVVLTVSLPLVAAWVRQYLNLQNVQTRANMINGAVSRAAATSLHDQKNGVSELNATNTALNYVQDSPWANAAIVNTGVSDEHLAAAVRSEVSRMVHEGMVVNVPVVTPTPPVSGHMLSSAWQKAADRAAPLAAPPDPTKPY